MHWSVALFFILIGLASFFSVLVEPLVIYRSPELRSGGTKGAQTAPFHHLPTIAFGKNGFLICMLGEFWKLEPDRNHKWFQLGPSLFSASSTWHHHVRKYDKGSLTDIRVPSDSVRSVVWSGHPWGMPHHHLGVCGCDWFKFIKISLTLALVPDS